MVDSAGGPDLGSHASIRINYGPLREMCLVVSGFVAFSVPDQLSLPTRPAEAMNRASVLELREVALESTLSSNNTWIEELKSQFASKNAKFDAVTLEL